ncbi:MAG: hypothetical protein FD123_2297 [Bacteroidetes bacterium]|nr:MAG: hypothetical protein FD123_2297 [Bacteroidota bacterium]
MRGDLADSLHLYPALIPFLFTWILLLLHLKFKFRNGAKWITYSFAATAVIVFVNFMIKMVFNFHTHH